MSAIRLLDLGAVPPVRSQTVYHAVARAWTGQTPDTIILVRPSNPYVCIGFHQDLAQEVDIARCRELGLPVYRREVGGGAVYLDDDQVFAQWVFAASRLPASLEERFALYVRPLVETYRSLGVDAEYRPVNDIHVRGKKIGGTGAAAIGDATVLVGSLMFDFDRRRMAQVLRVADEKMRDKVVQGLESYMTTLADERPDVTDRDAVVARYVAACQDALDAETLPGVLTEAEEAEARRLDAVFVSPEWLGRTGRRLGAGVKIHEGVRVVAGAAKAPGGLIRATVLVREGHVDDVELSGDFTILPADGLNTLEDAVRGASAEEAVLVGRLGAAFDARALVAPGLGPDDIARAIVAAVAPPAP